LLNGAFLAIGLGVLAQMIASRKPNSSTSNASCPMGREKIVPSSGHDGTEIHTLLSQLVPDEDAEEWIQKLSDEGISNSQDLLLLPDDDTSFPHGNRLLQLMINPPRQTASRFLRNVKAATKEGEKKRRTLKAIHHAAARCPVCAEGRKKEMERRVKRCRPHEKVSIPTYVCLRHRRKQMPRRLRGKQDSDPNALGGTRFNNFFLSLSGNSQKALQVMIPKAAEQGKRAKLRDIYDCIDVDHDGLVSRTELQQAFGDTTLNALLRLVPGVDMDQFVAMFQFSSEDEKGEVHFHTYITLPLIHTYS
jgi:hypothetical protein